MLLVVVVVDVSDESSEYIPKMALMNYCVVFCYVDASLLIILFADISLLFWLLLMVVCVGSSML